MNSTDREEYFYVLVARAARALLTEKNTNGMAFQLGGVRINIQDADTQIAVGKDSPSIQHLSERARRLYEI
jgi:hypothetical protein